MGQTLEIRDQIPPPDASRPTRMLFFPPWVESRLANLRENLQQTGATFQDVPTLSKELLPTTEQREAIANHVESLRSRLAQTPEMSDQAAQAAIVTITKMLLTLPGARSSETGIEAKGEAYLAAIDDVPFWAIEEGVRRWYRGECGMDERGKPYGYEWAPAPATLRRIARTESMRVSERLRQLERLLEAREFVECTADLAKGKSAWRGLLKAFTAHHEIKTLTFESAAALGSDRKRANEGEAA